MTKISFYPMKAVEVCLALAFKKKYIVALFLISTWVCFPQKAESIDSITYFKKLISTETNTQLKAAHYLSLANYYGSLNLKKDVVTNAFKALKIYESLQFEEKIADCNLLIFNYSEQKNNDSTRKFLDRYHQYALSHNDTLKMGIANKSYGFYYWGPNTYKTAKKHFQKGIKYSLLAKDSLTWAKTNGNLGLLYSGFEGKQDSARYFYQQELTFYQNNEKSNLRIATYINIANAYEKENQIEKALFYIKKVDSIPTTKHRVFYKKVIYGKYTKYYKILGDYKSALSYQENFIQFQDSLNTTQQNIAISELQTKYETEKKEKENILLKTDLKKKKQTQLILWIVIISSIIIGFTISLLISKNAKKKSLLNKQKQKIKIQQIEQELKEHELNSIDTLIAGQERERQRLAENLHDNLGATLVALKLNIQHIKIEESNSKTINNSIVLINDAYQKVRAIAHEKSTGVIAKNGLLLAIKDMAARISNENFKINVEDYGLENRLENTLEIRIFRIIQELITNVIKHANATEATISITNHNSTLNIIVEDNGKGLKEKFNPSKYKGLGLSAIEKRVENLNGTLEVDSYPNKGTSIIINLPL